MFFYLFIPASFHRNSVKPVQKCSLSQPSLLACETRAKMKIVMGKFYPFRGIHPLLVPLSSLLLWQIPTLRLTHPFDRKRLLLQMTQNTEILNLISNVLGWPWDARLTHNSLLSPSWVNSLAYNLPECVVSWATDFTWNDHVKSSVLHTNPQKRGLLFSQCMLSPTIWALPQEDVLSHFSRVKFAYASNLHLQSPLHWEW